MKIFLDSAEHERIVNFANTGLVDGVTTNPSLIAKSKQNITEVLGKICKAVKGPVSAEVVSNDYAGMVEEAKKLTQIAPNIVIKLPLTVHGLRVCQELRLDGVMVNVTLCFNLPQAILAAKSGATFISPFVGRIDDIGYNGSQLIAQIVEAYREYGYKTQVLAASIRTKTHVIEAIKAGAHAITIPPSLFESLYAHPLTQTGLEQFK